MTNKGPKEWTVRFNYNGESLYDVWEGESADDVLAKFQEYISTLEWWTFHLAGGRTLLVRTAFIGGVEVFK